MKLLRLGEPGCERPAVLTARRMVDVSSEIRDYDADFFATGGLQRLREFFDTGFAQLPDAENDQRIGPPIARPGQLWCVGVNYRDHAAESGLEVPAEPLVFGKSAYSVVGPDDDVHIPRGSTKTDWEVEIGVIIGSTARYLETDEQARAAIAGLTISHDVSERAWQLEHAGQWIKGKSFETFNPLGPWLVTLDEIADLDAIDLELDLNGEARQRGSTADMVFGILELVRYISTFTVLHPGDLINTGTPAGVGLGLRPQRFIHPGDVTELRATGLGVQCQRFITAP
jgi:2-keto-4-pentenoate hydratase/2-oxohepta-3-ene-1,7-dioic acid hydratase in catechol pathway